MATQHEKVAATLAELQAELAELDTIDAEEKRKLTETLAELRARLQNPAETDAVEHATNSAARRLGLAAGRLEGSHPTFSTGLSNIAGILGQMGF
jgi:hypothetical protein